MLSERVLRRVSFTITFATLASLAAVLLVARIYRHHEQAAGLAAEYYAGVAWAGTRVWRTVEAVPHAVRMKFIDVRDHADSNLSKINPAIEVYGR